MSSQVGLDLTLRNDVPGSAECPDLEAGERGRYALAEQQVHIRNANIALQSRACADKIGKIEIIAIMRTGKAQHADLLAAGNYVRCSGW
jgi:hypothetical protein